LIKSVWCLTFYVSDLEKAAKFYEETLGLDKKYEFSSYVGFQCGNLEIGLVPKPQGKTRSQKQTAGEKGPSVEFLVDDVEETYTELRRKRVKVAGELHDEAWGGRQAAFADPDGNVLEFVQINWEKYFSISARGAKRPREET
jgi:catechol 2,3-dioxygenase-like lactoylglutathione lyase family enzyme